MPAEVAKAAHMAMTLMVVDQPTPDFAAVFTRNAFPGAPVKVGRKRLTEDALGAILVNNKISNVCAPDGEATTETLCAAAGELLGIPGRQVFPGSTGVVGWRLPMKEMLAGLPGAVRTLQRETILPAAEAIMTTDLYPKVRSAEVSDGRIVGIAKGAGMIEPNLATMLVYLLTDVRISRARLRAMLPRVTAATFNRMSVDSDTSTSDTVLLVSSGKVDCEDESAFESALHTVCADLSEDIVRNGEGVRHVLEVVVSGAPSDEVAVGIGKSVVNAPLFKCAIAGNDPNVGRLVQAIGKYVGVHAPSVDLQATRITLGGIPIVAGGEFFLDPAKEARLVEHLSEGELYKSQPNADGEYRPPIDYPPHERRVHVHIDLGCGPAQAAVLGADLTHEYVTENADYRS